ncbi:MAG: transposase [Anaerolineae bacterium]|jgi:putative transposase|nr:transposase [Anaerolineae bacterium]
MSKQRRRHSAEFKFQVALDAVKGLQTINELASHYGVHPNQVSQWKQTLLQDGASLFSQHNARLQREQAALQAELYEQIGRLQMELEWLKKSCPMRLRPGELLDKPVLIFQPSAIIQSDALYRNTGATIRVTTTGRLRQVIEELHQIKMGDGVDGYAQARHEFIKRYLCALDGKSAQRVAEALSELMVKCPPPVRTL